MTIEDLRFTLRIVSIVAGVATLIIASYGMYQLHKCEKILEEAK